MFAAIRRIAYYLPAQTLDNAQLAAEFEDWTAEKISEKTGIDARHIAAPGECVSDMAIAAARKLFGTGACAAGDVDFILLCTQSPDYFLPTTACLVQHALGIPATAGALDFNLGCSGWVYGLGLAQGLIQTGQARRVLLLTSETYSKYIHARDKSVRTIFGDAAAATLVEAHEGEGGPFLGPFVYGTDGSGAENLMVPAGAMREPSNETTGRVEADGQGNARSRDNLYMNGAEIFNFTLKTVPASVEELLRRSGLSLDEVDLFVFPQANQYMLQHLRKKLKIPAERFSIRMRACGNTVSSTIPIALADELEAGNLHAGQRVMAVGFGVGYSWAAALLRWV